MAVARQTSILPSKLTFEDESSSIRRLVDGNEHNALAISSDR